MLTSKPGWMLVLLAAIPLVWFVIQLRILSLVAIAAIFGGIVLLRRGIDGFTVAVLVVSLSSLLVAIDSSLTKRRLKRLENCLGPMEQSIRALEIAEERWQGSIARRQFPVSSGVLLDGEKLGAKEAEAEKASH